MNHNKTYQVKIDHLGAARCATGSCHLVRFSGNKNVNILVDCGKAQGHDLEMPLSSFLVKPEYIDHTGQVLNLINVGFDGEIITTPSTKAFLSPML